MIRAVTIIFCSLSLLLPTWVTAATIPRIAVLISHDIPATKQMQAGFQEYFVSQKQQVELVVHSMTNDEPAAATLNWLRHAEVKLVLALGTRALETVSPLADVPVVGSLTLQNELIDNNRHITGVKLGFSLDEQIFWLKKVLPQVKNVGVIYSSEENQALMQQADKLLAKQGLTLHQVQIDDPARIMDALKMLERRVDVLLGITDSTVLNTSTAKDVLLFSLRNRIAFIGLSEAWVKAGAIYALERDYQDMGRQCGEMALKILAGQQPENLKPVSPRTVRYFLNQQIAERLKINVSEELIANAESVF